MNNPIILIAIAAIGFGLWPSIARLSGLSPILIALIVGSGTVLPVIMLMPFFEIGIMTRNGFYTALAAGLINGVGFTAYSKLVSNSGWDISIYLPIAITGALIVATASGILFFSEPLTAKKITGVILALAASWLLLK